MNYLMSDDEMARLFHDTYEELAPEFGYVTRDDTHRFDPDSPNGKLMTTVCQRVRAAIIQSDQDHRVSDDEFCMEAMNDDNLRGYDYASHEHIDFINKLLDNPDDRIGMCRTDVQQMRERLWQLIDDAKAK